MIKLQRRKSFNIVWFDDQKKIFETSIRSIQEEFKQIYKCNLNFQPFSDYNEFINYFRDKKDEIDIIFLDIDLGELSFDGIYVYEEIRKYDADLKIIFVSGNLTNPEWQSKIENFKKQDPNLQTIKLSFPFRSEKFEYYNLVSSPIVKFINSITGLFKQPYDVFLKNEQKQREESIKNITLFNRPFVNNYFSKRSDVDWMIIGKEPEKILREGAGGIALTSKELIEISEREGVMVCGYQRNTNYEENVLKVPQVQDYITQKKAITIDNIYAKILYVEDQYVILKCLIDEDKRIFEVREVDIEILKGVTEIEMNNIVEIKTITYTGEVRVLFRNGNKSLISKFSNQIDINENRYSFDFKPLPSKDEDNF